MIRGAIVMISVALIGNKYLLLVPMVGGIARASIVSMPYAMLSGVMPEDKIGVYMGGVSLGIAALLTLRVRVPAVPTVTKAT